MKTNRMFFMTLLALIVASGTAVAQKVGSTSMQFLKVMPCARATALGDAYSVLAIGAEAAFWNPAGVAQSERSEFSLTYLKWIFDTQQGAFSYSMPLSGWGSVALQVQYVDFGEFEEALWDSPYKDDIQYPGLTGRTFRPYSYVVGLTYASKITDKFATGLTVKLAHESLYDGQVAQAVTSKDDTVEVNTWANGLLFDFGLQYNTGFRTVRIAASMQNFGANIRYGQEANPVPMGLRVGIAADLLGVDALLMPDDGHRLTVAFDLFQPNDYEQQAHIGMEYELSRTLALRVGNKFNYDADGLTLGVGLQQQISSMNVRFDYSFSSLNYDLGNVHRITLGAGF